MEGSGHITRNVMTAVRDTPNQAKAFFLLWQIQPRQDLTTALYNSQKCQRVFDVAADIKSVIIGLVTAQKSKGKQYQTFAAIRKYVS